MIKDAKVAWNTKRVFRDAKYMTGMINGTGEAAGGPVVAAHSVGASEQCIVQVGADGDEFYDFFPLPWDFDRKQPIRFRVIFSHSSVHADSPVWHFSYQAVAAGEAIADVTAHETLTTSGTPVSTTADALEVWDWEESASNLYITASDYAIKVKIECDSLGGANTNEIELFGYEIEYVVGATGASNKRDLTKDGPVGYAYPVTS